MAIVRSQRAAIETILAASPKARFKRPTKIRTVVRNDQNLILVSLAGESFGDDVYHRFRDVPVKIFRTQDSSCAVETIEVSGGTACVLDEPAPDGKANEHSLVLLLPEHGPCGVANFIKSGRPTTYFETI